MKHGQLLFEHICILWDVYNDILIYCNIDCVLFVQNVDLVCV